MPGMRDDRYPKKLISKIFKKTNIASSKVDPHTLICESKSRIHHLEPDPDWLGRKKIYKENHFCLLSLTFHSIIFEKFNVKFSVVDPDPHGSSKK